MNKENKVKLSTIIIIVVLLIIALAAAIIFQYKVDDTNQNNQLPYNDTSANSEVSDVNPVINKTDLTMNFLKLENEKKNLIYSPLSIQYALNMLNEGAKGNTKLQIEKLLANKTLTQYDNKENVLSLANTIYIRDSYKPHVKEEFTNTLIQKYNAEVQYDTFQNANNVNRWIEQKTLGTIKDMIQDEDVRNPYLELILINALAIDMDWKVQFDQVDTEGEIFYLADGKEMQATTMNKKVYTDSASYYKDNKITSLTMDLKEYDDTQLEFIAVMPNDNSLVDYVKQITIEDINQIAEKSTKASETKSGIKIKIPKFEYSYNLKLKADLRKLGMTDVFDAKLADLTNIGDTALYVSDALHKADIKFTEKGIKAAAVTALLVKDSMAIEEKKPEEVIIDKPFLYVIRDKNTKEVWFVGTVYEPNSWEKEKAEYNKR